MRKRSPEKYAQFDEIVDPDMRALTIRHAGYVGAPDIPAHLRSGSGQDSLINRAVWEADTPISSPKRQLRRGKRKSSPQLAVPSCPNCGARLA